MLDAAQIYEDARRAFAALETLLGEEQQQRQGEEEEEESGWFFGAQRPSLFDAAVFSYTCLILNDEAFIHPNGEAVGWGDDTLRRILVEECPLLVAHVRRIRQRCWREEEEEK